MEPALREGDWVLVDPDAYRLHPLAVGDVVVVPDPRAPARILIKRVAALDTTGRLRLTGDRAEGSTDSRTFGTVDPAAIRGQAWARYWPPRRIGRIR